MTDKARRIADWVEDIRETIGNIRSDIGHADQDRVPAKTESPSAPSSKA
jgi:hypothetical protein